MLLLKFLDKFYNHVDIPSATLTQNNLCRSNTSPLRQGIPRGYFQWKEILKPIVDFRKLAMCSPSKGDTSLFQEDLWPINTLQECFPQLFSSAKKLNCSGRYFLDNTTSPIFSLPLSAQASQQLNDLLYLIQERIWDPMVHGKWQYIWGTNTFRPTKHTLGCQGFNKFLHSSNGSDQLANLGKHKFFVWLLLRDKPNTINLLRRKNRHLDYYICVFCNGGSEETVMHLFFECPCIQACWISVSIIWNLTLQALDMILDAINLFESTIFREVVITDCWVIWKTRNNIISFLTMQAPR